MSLVTRCPYCDTSFRVTDEQLAAADGTVRCGACLAVFSAPDHLVEELPQDADQGDTSPEEMSESAPFDEVEWREWVSSSDELEDESESAHSPDMELEDYGSTAGEFIEPDDDLSPDDVDWHDAELASEIEDEVEEQASDEPDYWNSIAIEEVDEPEAEQQTGVASSDSLDDLQLLDEMLDEGDFDAELDVETSAEDLIGEYVPPVKRHYVAWTSGCILLLAVLATQFAWFNRDVLAQNPGLRGYYESACSVIGCDLPVYRDMRALHVAHLVVRSDPAVGSALLVDAIIRNDAPWRQYFPDLRLRFADVQGQLVAVRSFRPSEYLGGEMTGVKFIPAKTEVRISLEIVDPGTDATNYSLNVVR